MKHLYLIHFIVLLCFTPDITLAQVWGNCLDDISCQPTLYQVYGDNNNQARILSYDSNLDISVTLNGSYQGFLNAAGYSSARNRAYAIGCTGSNPNSCNGFHQLVEIGIDGSGMTPTANFCVKGSLNFGTAPNCAQVGYLQQGDIVSWNIGGNPVEALVFRSGSGNNNFLNYVVVYDPGNQLGGPSLNVTCVDFGNIASNTNTTNLADLAYDPGTNKLFGVNPNGALVFIDGPTGNNWTADIDHHTVNTDGNRFVYGNGSPLATPGVPYNGSFGAVYISKDSGGNSILMCTDNSTGNSFRSSKNIAQIVVDTQATTNPWQWQLFTNTTQGNLDHNDGFSCPTAMIITCNQPTSCEFFLQPVSSSPEESPEDSCRFKASVFVALDEFGNPMPVPYDFEWDITVGGVSQVYQGYDLQTVWFNVPMNSKNKEICLTLSDPNDPTCFMECCKDIICDCPVEVSSFENFDANLTRLTAVDSIGDCCYEICPSLLTGSAIDPDFLCVMIDWGDGGPLEQGPFNSCFQHCYLSGTSCDDIACHEITVYAYCCQNEVNFLNYLYDEQLYPYAMTWTGDANCCPLTAPEEQPIDCYIRNAFWVDAMWESVDGMCTVSFSGTQFLGIDMVSHNSPVWSLPNNPNIEATASGTFIYDNFTIFAPVGTYQVCRSLNGLAVDGSTCSTTSCHDVVVNCGSDAVYCSEDLNGDGNIGVDDLLALLGAYGASCE